MTTHHARLAFAERRSIVGMVHVAALPGTPHHESPVDHIVKQAVDEARLLVERGCDALIIENMHDRPYLNRSVGPEIVAGMTAVTIAVRRKIAVPIGIQVLAGANREALAVAQAGGADFVRVEGFVFAQVADEGLMPDADAGSLLRYRRQIGADHIAVLADIKKKHASHNITADVDLAETARAAQFFGADGVVVTGIATGRATSADDVKQVVEAVQVPVAIGSGLTSENLEDYWPLAAMFIVGSSIKHDGLWSNPIDPARLDSFMQAVARLRES